MGDSFVAWISHLDRSDIKLAGGKGANLGEMYHQKYPVPNAFVVSTNAFSFFLSETKLTDEITELIRNIDVDNTYELRKKSQEIRNLIIGTEMPRVLEAQILEAYDHFNVDLGKYKDSPGALAILQSAREPVFVSVRSSSTAEDLEGSSFAGQQDSFINVKGNRDLIDHIKKVFASVFTARAMYYREKKGFSGFMPVAVIVQRMIDSEKSGVIFSKHPVKGTDEILIESVWGQGDGIVSGKIKPDQHVVSKDLEVIEEHISEKKYAVVRNSSGQTKMVELKDEIANRKVLKTHEIKSLAEYAMNIEEHYGIPQDIEFAIENNEIFILQTRPISTLNKEHKSEEIDGQIVSQGLGASPGIASGSVKLIHSMDDLAEVKEGDILITNMTNPDMVLTMQKAAGIVTSEGGITAHAAIVSREMGIPCVVGAQNIMSSVHDSQEITVDGYNGKVFTGTTQNQSAPIEPVVSTNTNITVMIDLPRFADRAAQAEASGVGLIRLEGIIALSKTHPVVYEKEKRLDEYEQVLVEGLRKIGEKFVHKSMWIRTSDLQTSEYANLEGAPKKVEHNPILGLHGIRFSLKHEGIFRAELRAIKKMCDLGHNVGVMFPQIISVSELERAKQIFDEEGCGGVVKIGIMVETPAATVIIKDLLSVGLDFVTIGTNDLAQYTLAVDRTNEEVQHLYDELHFAVQKQIARVIRECQSQNVSVSICGQATSNPTMIDLLIRKGVSSICVHADEAKRVSQIVAGLESGKHIDEVMLELEGTEKIAVAAEHEETVQQAPQEQIEQTQEEPQQNKEYAKDQIQYETPNNPQQVEQHEERPDQTPIADIVENQPEQGQMQEQEPRDMVSEELRPNDSLLEKTPQMQMPEENEEVTEDEESIKQSAEGDIQDSMEEEERKEEFEQQQEYIIDQHKKDYGAMTNTEKDEEQKEQGEFDQSQVALEGEFYRELGHEITEDTRLGSEKHLVSEDEEQVGKATHQEDYHDEPETLRQVGEMIEGGLEDHGQGNEAPATEEEIAERKFGDHEEAQLEEDMERVKEEEEEVESAEDLQNLIDSSG